MYAYFFSEQECDPVTARARMNKYNFTDEKIVRCIQYT